LPNIPLDLLAEKLPGILADIPYKICLGAELEFYLKGRELDVRDLVTDLKSQYPHFEEERGWDQFENVFEHRFDILDLIEEINNFKAAMKIEARKYGCMALFGPKPFDSDYGSALHFHLSLHDDYNINIFEDDEINSNRHLQNCIGGILDVLEESLYLLCRNDNAEFERFDGKYMAPQNVSWGGNNRSTSLRIPESEPKHRRIEFRVPSSNADPSTAILVLLFGLMNGLEINKNEYPRIYGNAFDPQYELKSFPDNCAEAKKIFQNAPKIGNYISKYLGSCGV